MTPLVMIEGTGDMGAAPFYHVIAGDPPILFLTESSQMFSVDHELAQGLKDGSPDAIAEIALLHSEIAAPNLPLPPEPLAISLNIAQSCNLSCSYCYADEGRFGGHKRMMTVDTALAAIDRLLESPGTERISVGFIGGEPLLNRPVLHASVAYAADRAARLGRNISFGITTNGTLLEPDDIALFRSHPFAVTVSLDGPRDLNDSLRRFRNLRSSFDAATDRMRPLLQDPGCARIAARATITRRDLNIAEHVDALASAGFCEIGVSPLRTSPDAALALTEDDWPVYLSAVKTAAEKEWQRVQRGGDFLFSNLAIALKELHRGAWRTLPCGAANNYVSVSARGDYFSCHRTIDDPRFFLGSSEAGPSHDARQAFVRARRVDTQQPCRTCWARYLCGGGCHAEVVRSGRAGCDYIRGWLEYCISLYPQVLAARPDLIGAN
jgi:uncharacterized protein